MNGIPNARFAKASVNNVNGLILFPDQYKHPDDIALPETINIDTAQYTSRYSASQWKKMENAGAVIDPSIKFLSDTAQSTRYCSLPE